MKEIAIIGAGRAGTALAVSLAANGYKVSAVASRSFASAKKLSSLINGCTAYNSIQAAVDSASVVFIAVPDSVIEEVASSLRWREGMYAVHLSGAHTSSLLESAKDNGAHIGVFHPLQTFSGGITKSDVMKGVTFAIEASPPLLEYLREIAHSLGGNPVIIDAKYKALYHASAVMASNYLITLLKNAADMWEAFGVKRSEAITALSPLVMQTVKNASDTGVTQALTGPIARGDAETIEKHLKAIKCYCPQHLNLYSYAGIETLPLALENNTINKEKAEKLLQMFKDSFDFESGGPLSNENNA